MLNPKLPPLPQLKASFSNAKPFKHLCIDDFFIPTFAEQLLTTFPDFDTTRALNELGRAGGKATREDVRNLGQSYVILDDYIASPSFLRTISEITGIPDLLYDPGYFGGGTHENVHSQELDPHVDFNYDRSRKLHRRLNLIVYLNKEWQIGWGGEIEIHSNPREPDENTILSFAPIFNRCVMFETNEISWHGFPRINLPEEKRALSRKSFAIYLYSCSRPEEEIAPPHRTFYVQRPLPKSFVPSSPVSQEQFDEIRSLIRKRDEMIHMYQALELSMSREIETLRQLNADLLSHIRVNTTGYVSQVGVVSGFSTDGWAGTDFKLRCVAHRPVTGLEITLSRPTPGTQAAAVTVSINGAKCQMVTLSAGMHITLALRMQCRAKEEFEITLSGPTFSPKELGINEDERELLCRVHLLMALHT